MSDIDTAAADSLKVLDPKQPIREADIRPIRSIALTYRQVELVEKGNFKGQIVERAVRFLAMLNDLMANYQTLRRRISPLAE